MVPAGCLSPSYRQQASNSIVYNYLGSVRSTCLGKCSSFYMFLLIGINALKKKVWSCVTDIFFFFASCLKLKLQGSENFSWQGQFRPFRSLQHASVKKCCVTAFSCKALYVEFMKLLVAGATCHCCAPESNCIASPSPNTLAVLDFHKGVTC